MIRFFLDASALFAAADSATGGSREIIRLGFAGEVDLVVSELVLEEARRNLAAKAPRAVPAFEVFVASAPFTVIDATRAQVVAMARHTVLKDAPVVAAAKRARAVCLVSLDRKHLLGNHALEEAAGLRILTPGAALRLLRETREGDDQA